MKEIQGRLTNKNKLRSPLGRVEKQRPIQPLTCLCCLLQHHHAQGDSLRPCSCGWPSMRTPVLRLPLCPSVQPWGPVAHRILGGALSAPAPSAIPLVAFALPVAAPAPCGAGSPLSLAKDGPQSSLGEPAPQL